MATTPGQITTTIVVSFGTGGLSGEASAHLSAEIDSRPDGYNKGITNFIFGDSPVYLVYKTSNVNYTQRSSQGSIGGVGAATIDMDEIITFAESREGSLSKPAAGGVAFTNLGGDAATFQVAGTNVIADRPIFGVYRAVYQASATAYSLSGVSQYGTLPNMSVLILIKGTITP